MNKVELYESASGDVVLNVRSDDDTVWLTRQQLATLFGRDVKTIGKHIANAQREELDGISVVAKFATTAADGKTYRVQHYNLDLIISVGYRVKSAEGVHFRRWANDVLKRYLVQGAVINESRLAELGKVVSVLSRSSDQLASGIAEVVSAYLPGLVLLHDYDEGRVDISPEAVPTWELTLVEARNIIATVAAEFPADTLAGRERGDALEGIVAAVYQSFGGQDVYPTTEEKAAHLLYFVIKDHPLADGNKRSAAALFVTFLARNGLLNEENGNPRVTNSGLAALTLLVAASDPREKDLMVSLIIKMLEAGS
ncbi:RhuM family protein [Glutamicibacter sp. NPDC087344]|uniref:RhuM family protein n=1 Tax=Glutamicibacter sp. NPDC087344 TaxID=3363994 RepID=UPI0037F64D96